MGILKTVLFLIMFVLFPCMMVFSVSPLQEHIDLEANREFHEDLEAALEIYRERRGHYPVHQGEPINGGVFLFAVLVGQKDSFLIGDSSKASIQQNPETGEFEFLDHLGNPIQYRADPLDSAHKTTSNPGFDLWY